MLATLIDAIRKAHSICLIDIYRTITQANEPDIRCRKLPTGKISHPTSAKTGCERALGPMQLTPVGIFHNGCITCINAFI